MIQTTSAAPATATGIGKYRWTICSLVFFATTVNYLDRAVISLLKPYLETEFHWNAGDYANIEIAFKLAYSLGMLGVGRIIDKLGTKMGYALSTFLWSLAAIGHALVSSTLGFSVARAFLGVTEAGNFPAAIKTTAEWFPQKERALATGIFNSGSNVGAIIAPLTVPWIAETWGWKWAFVITGALGFVWLVLWFVLYEVPAKHAKLTKAEFEYIHSDVDDMAAASITTQPKVSWFKLLTFRQTWGFVLGKFLTDPIWWFYLFWLPDFLSKQYGLKGTDIALPVAMVYMLSSIGSVGGGWIPLNFIKHGMPAFKARKTSMLLIALCVFPIVFAQRLGQVNMWLAVLVIGIAAAAHQAWSANIFTTVSDMFPKRAVASVTGIGGMAGGMGGIVLSALVQKRMFVYYESIGQLDKAYFIMFWICGGAYLLAWVLMHFLAPTMKQINLDETASTSAAH
ncbi:MFS transporter, ACS family, hexuronate transporter [Hymenobacter gelipurpurascens]|uniref:MFS transporter, ACS family, hexuronate transporter n=1 Tax=Hymenobacter gelipurpurascens TaxID=89968 RepID=A0A212TJW5_9BACT|nr:MFS transporter [Hymenobacter gelipurpurascens]SNC66302.1 MFS transporter, ACS family, hexuronate transporter [Hymenobacter gelipurpurascens]